LAKPVLPGFFANPGFKMYARVRKIPVQYLIPDTIRPNNSDTDTGCDVIALCGLTD
jgi:hypothetical protein